MWTNESRIDQRIGKCLTTVNPESTQVLSEKPIEPVAEKHLEYYWWQALVLAPAGFDLESSGCKWRQWMAFDLASGPYLVSGRGRALGPLLLLLLWIPCKFL